MEAKGARHLRRVVVPPRERASSAPVIDTRPQPNLYTSSLGQYAQLAQWIDTNLGNRDGVITVAELQAYVARYGHDPRNHHQIVGLAMMLGVSTVQVGNQIAIANVGNIQISVNGGQVVVNTQGGGGVRYQAQTVAPPRTNDVYETARALVRVTPGASRAATDEAIRSLASLPPVILGILARRGTTVIVASTITEYRPDLRFERPRGWPPGSTWQQPAGMHDPSRNEIVLAHGGTSPRVVFHEVGHALDCARGWALSPNATFMKMYNADFYALQVNREHYLTQPGVAGPSEAFAESHMWFHTNPQWLQRAYPNLHAYWQWVQQNGWREVGA